MLRITSCYQLFYKHPLLSFTLLFLVYLRTSFPFVFFLLISASPVVVCTAMLLAFLLALGQKQARGTENDALKYHKFSSNMPYCTSQSNYTTTYNKGNGIDVGSSINGDGGGGGGFVRDKFAEVRKDIVEKEMKDSSSIDGYDSKMKGSNGNNSSMMFAYNEKFPKTEFKSKERMGARAFGYMYEPSRKDKADGMGHYSSLSPSSSSPSASEDDSNVVLKSSKDYVPTFCDYHPLEDLVDHQGLHDESPKIIKERHIKFKETKEDDEVTSTIQEDHEELSSSDDEHKQQLEGLIEERSHAYDIDVHDDNEDECDDDDDEEIEDKDIEEDEEEEDEEDHNVEQEGIQTMVNWTEEDEKNLKDLARLELERNRQLERIMSKRIAQRTYSTITEKSLVDLDTSDLAFPVTPTSTKTNPFDSTYPTSPQPDIPPIPGSAPALLPRQNPFDDVNDDSQENKLIPRDSTIAHRLVSINTTTSSSVHHHHHHQQNKTEHTHSNNDSAFLSRHPSFNRRHNDEREGGGVQQHQDGDEASKREALFRRYQSFGVVGSSFYGFLWQENGEESSYPPFTPYLAPHEEDHINESDSTEEDSSQGSVSAASSSFRAEMEDRDVSSAATSSIGHVENANESSSSSSSRTNMVDQEVTSVANSSIEDHVENASKSSAEANMDKTLQEKEDAEKENGEPSSSEAEKEPKSLNVVDDTTHIEPVYDSYDTSTSNVVNNIFVGPDSSRQEEVKSES